MINNRQNGRRRGRGGGSSGAPRPNGGNGGQDRGNRIDNRARGNAAQLLEKYKALARDAQMQGDRVNTEYYLQFADHYFRVLAESRSRFEDQQPRPRRDDFSQSDEDYGDEGERIGADEQGNGDQGDYQGDGDDQPRYEEQQRSPRNDRQGHERQGNERQSSERQSSERQSNDRQANDRQAYDRNNDRGDRQGNDRPAYRDDNRRDDQERRPRRDRAPRFEGQAPMNQASAQQMPATQATAQGESPQPEVNGNVGAPETQAPQPKRRGRPPRVAEPVSEESGTIDMDRLPPSFSLTAPVNDAGGEEEAEKPRRRTRKPRGEEAVA